MKITLCMIVRDEEKYIEQCLKNAFQFVDDAVIVDTGSQDRTKEIIKKFNNVTLIDCKWENDFSKARNLSLEHATGNWILMLDADEFIEGDSNEIRKIIESTKYEALTIPLYNILDDNEVFFSSLYYKLFKNKGYRYFGALHEQLNIKNTLIGNVNEEICKIVHYGYLTENINEKDKNNRNISILQCQIERDSKNPFLYYNLGVALYNIGKYSEALESYIKCENLSNGVGEYHIDMTRKIAKCLYMLKKYKQCIKFIEELFLENELNKYVDLHYINGVCYFDIKNYSKAEEEFKRCIKMGDTSEYVSNIGVGSYKAKLMLARVYKNQNKINEAAMQYIECIFDNKNAHKEGLAETINYLQVNNMKEIFNELNVIIGINKDV